MVPELPQRPRRVIPVDFRLRNRKDFCMANINKSQPVAPRFVAEYGIFLCPTCEVEVTTVDIDEVRACTCCDQKLKKVANRG